MACLCRKTEVKRLFSTNWHLQIDNSSSGIIYKLITTKFGFENYFVTFPCKLKKAFVQIRTRNNRPPIKTGRWQRILMDERICFLCNSNIGDEFHFILEGKELNDVRKQYLKPYNCKGPNILKFYQPFHTENRKALFSLSRFTLVILSDKYIYYSSIKMAGNR